MTGVTRRAGIGAAIARELGRAGARLFVTFFRQYDRQQAWGVEPNEPESLLSELRSIADDVGGIELDLSQPASPAELFRQALQRFGSIDILVNNAAHWEEGGIGQVRAEQLDRHYAVNVRASVLLCAEFARHKKPNTPGRIINMTSGQNYNPMPGQIAYVVTKSALDALTLTLSSELAGSGITVNAVDPGPTDTGWISNEVRSKLLQGSPEGISSPEAIGRLVRLLAGDDAASITGQVIRAQAAGTAALFTKAAGYPERVELNRRHAWRLFASASCASPFSKATVAHPGRWAIPGHADASGRFRASALWFPKNQQQIHLVTRCIIWWHLSIVTFFSFCWLFRDS